MKRERSRTISNWMSWGRPFCTSASRAFTRSTTATVLVPDCLRMRRDTALEPLAERARLLLRVRHRGDVAHADRAALEVGHDEVVERLDRLDAAQGAQAFLVAARGEPPAGISTFCAGGVLHLLDGQVEGGELVRVDEDLDLALPVAHQGDGAHVLDRLQRPLDRLSAISVISRAERWPETTRAMMGAESGSTFSTMGESCAGSRESTVPTFSRTSLAASCTLRSSTKVAKTCSAPRWWRSAARPAR